LRCLFCQNHSISQTAAAAEVESEALAAIMLELQRAGCHNINLVSPSHVVAPILEALVPAAAAGLHLPLVYNTGGYDSIEALELLDGVIDIYMPDMKYASTATARRLSNVLDYPTANRAAVREMHRQVGDLVLDDDGLAVRGLLLRHLVLPAGLAGTGPIMRFLAQEISPNTYLNLMDQYRPQGRPDPTGWIGEGDLAQTRNQVSFGNLVWHPDLSPTLSQPSSAGTSANPRPPGSAADRTRRHSTGRRQPASCLRP
jgi:putative pyruvate formate lyase activating enzyme